MERLRLREVSPRKLAANRQNALHSTGPVTPTGKAIVRRNPIQHGLSSTAIVVRDEKPEDWDAHVEAVVTDLEPRGYVEEELARQVAWHLWRLRRVARYEAEATRAAGENAAQLAFSGLCSPEQIERLAVLPDNKRLVKVMRAEAHYNRSLARALRQLNESRQARGRELKVVSAVLEAVTRMMEDYQADPRPIVASVVPRKRLLPDR